MQAGYRKGAKNNRAKRVGSTLLAGVILLLLLLLQTTILPTISIYSAVPYILLVFCVCYSFIQGGATALVFSVFAGFLQETLNGGAMGYNALLYLLFSWICVFLHDHTNGRNYLLVSVIVFFLTLFYGCFRLGVPCSLWNAGDLGRLFLRPILPSALYSTLTAPMFVFLVDKLICRRDWV